MFPCLLIALSIPSVDIPDAKTKAEVKWARSAATDFLEAVTTGQEETAWGLLAPELARSVRAKNTDYHLNSAGCYRDPRITSEEVSPNGNEVVFVGVLRDGSASATFRLRVVRDGKDCIWRVRFLSIKDNVPNR
jgi:hypothetical protein